MDDGTPGFNAVLALKTARADKTLPPTSSVQLARNISGKAETQRAVPHYQTWITPGHLHKDPSTAGGV